MTELEKLYRHHASEVHRFCFWLCGDAQRADDLTSEVFVRAWAGIDRIRAGTARAYLLTIARNLHRQDHRRTRRNAPLDPEIADPGPGPERTGVARQELANVLRDLREPGAIFFSALPLSVHGDSSGVTWLAAEQPFLAAAFAAVGAALWIAFATQTRRVRSAGL